MVPAVQFIQFDLSITMNNALVIASQELCFEHILRHKSKKVYVQEKTFISHCVMKIKEVKVKKITKNLISKRSCRLSNHFWQSKFNMWRVQLKIYRFNFCWKHFLRSLRMKMYKLIQSAKFVAIPCSKCPNTRRDNSPMIVLSQPGMTNLQIQEVWRLVRKWWWIHR